MDEQTRKKLLELKNRREAIQGNKPLPKPGDGKNIAQKAWGAIKEPAKAILDYPEYGATELAQRSVEAQQSAMMAGKPQGIGRIAEMSKHFGKEFASDVLALPSQLTGGAISDAWAEEMDPSKNTYLGTRVEDAYQEFRNQTGKDPSLSEKYGIIRNIQDQYDNELNSIFPDRPINIKTQRNILTGLTLAGAVVAERGVVRGSLAAAKGIKKANQARKGLPRVAGKIAEETAMILPRIDNAIGKTILWPLKTAGRLSLGGARITRSGLNTLVDRIRRKGKEEGLPSSEVDKKVQELQNNLTENNNVKNVFPGQKTSIDNPKITDKKIEPRPYEAEETVKMQSAHDNSFGIPDFTPTSPRTGFGSKMYNGIRAVRQNFRNTFGENKMSAQQIKQENVADNARLDIKKQKDPAQNRVESSGVVEGNQVKSIFRFIDQNVPNLLTKESDGKKEFNHKFSREYFTKNNLPQMAPSAAIDPNGSWAREHPNDVIGSFIPGRTISRTLDPDVATVMETLPHHKEALQSIEIPVTDELLKSQWGSKEYIRATDGQISPTQIANVFGKQKGETLNVYDMLEEISSMSARKEADRAEAGVSDDFTKEDVLRSDGASYFHRSVIKDAKSENTKEFFQNKIKKTADEGRNPQVFRSASEGMTQGFKYKAPWEAYEELVLETGSAVIDSKVAKYLSNTALENGLEYGNLEQLIGNRFYKTIDDNLLQLKRKLVDTARESKIRGSIKAANEIMTNIKDEVFVRPGLTADNTDSVTNLTNIELNRLEDAFGELNLNVDDFMTKYKVPEADKLEIRSLLKNADIKNLGDDVREGMGQLENLGFESHYFPSAFRNAAQKAIQDIRGTEVQKSNMIRNLNSMLRTFGATGDFSGVGIQGWAAMAREIGTIAEKGKFSKELKSLNSGASYNALKFLYKPFVESGEDIVGDYLVRKTQLGKLNGTLTPQDAVESGLALYHQAPDMFINRAQWFSRLPGGKYADNVLRAFDQSFTNYGNILRYELFEKEMLYHMLNEGKTARELIDSGTASEIATALNTITGVGKREFLGSTGQFLIFAPRYFYARFKMTFDGMRGLAKTAIPGQKPTLEQKYYVQTFASLLGLGTTTTFMINGALGEETDVIPWKKNESTGEYYANPNFMRIRIGGQDISLFGPVDAILRILMTPAYAAINTRNNEKIIDLDELQNDIRPLVSGPLLGGMWDLLNGEDAIGNKTRKTWDVDEEGNVQNYDFLESLASVETGEFLAEHLVPFALDEVFFADPGKESVVQRIYESGKKGDVPEAVAGMGSAAFQAGGQFIGLRGSRMSLNEILNEGYNDILQLSPSDERLKEVFGRSDRKRKDYIDSISKGKWDDGKLNLTYKSLIQGERTPHFSDIDKDYQNNIKRLVEEGRFNEILSIEEMANIETRMRERIENSATLFDKYRVQRDKISDDELQTLIDKEDVFAKNPVSIATFLKNQRNTRRASSEERRKLVEGEYKEIEELFKYGRDSALGKLSTVDPDIYDYASATYYDTLFGENGIINEYGVPNWHKKERALKEWSDGLQERYPSLKNTDVLSYMFRIESANKKDSPPITTTLEEMQDLVENSGYYDIENDLLNKYLDRAGAKSDIYLQEYDQWKLKVRNDQDRFVEGTAPWIEDFTEELSDMRGVFLDRNRRVEAVLQIISSGDRSPRTSSAKLVDNILLRNEKRPFSITKLNQLFNDLLNDDITDENERYRIMYNNFYKS